jgi:GNAT superfamily N-acetyltransferase
VNGKEAYVSPTSGSDVVVRRLQPQDIERVIGLDAKIVGRRRDGYLRPKLREALTESGIQVSLVGEVDQHVAGFLLAKVYYGEFGVAEPTAILDTIGVSPDDRGHGVASALLEQLRTNLRGLGIARLGTEVHWDDQRLLSFFHHEGFTPAHRICLECDLDDPRLRERADARGAEVR